MNNPIYCDHCGEEVNKVLRPSLTQEQVIKRVHDKVLGDRGLIIEHLQSKIRLREIVYARYLCSYIIWRCTKITYLKLGRMYGKDHSTAIHGVCKIRDFMDIDRMVKAEVEDLIFDLKLTKEKTRND